MLHNMVSMDTFGSLIQKRNLMCVNRGAIKHLLLEPKEHFITARIQRKNLTLVLSQVAIDPLLCIHNLRNTSLHILMKDTLVLFLAATKITLFLTPLTCIAKVPILTLFVPPDLRKICDILFLPISSK